MKVVINVTVGGFSISKKAAEYMRDRGHERAAAEIRMFDETAEWYGYGYSEEFNDDDGYVRTDPLLIEAVEALGQDSWGRNAELKVVEVPDDVDWYVCHIESGIEEVREKHRIWR